MMPSNGLRASEPGFDQLSLGSNMLSELIVQAAGLSPACAKLLLFM
jgi:hypothetical protein